MRGNGCEPDPDIEYSANIAEFRIVKRHVAEPQGAKSGIIHLLCERDLVVHARVKMVEQRLHREHHAERHPAGHEDASESRMLRKSGLDRSFGKSEWIWARPSTAAITRTRMFAMFSKPKFF